MARNLRKHLASSLGLAAAATLALANCQSYEFEQVTPKAFGSINDPRPITGKMLPPYIMLVVDKSGSMLDSVVASGQRCVGDNGYDPNSPNPCKWNELKEVFTDSTSGFLPTSRDLARFGLSLYPTGNMCDAGQISVPLDPDNSNVDVIMSQLNAVNPEGGTPTSLTVTAASQDQRLVNPEPGRLRFVMLLTDGLPNCNGSPENAARCEACNQDASTCRDATRNGCFPSFSDPYTCWDEQMYLPKGSDCLDDAATSQAIATLHQNGIDTFVIGFGDAFGGDGHRVLNAAAEAGGRPRQGTDTKYFKAANKEELKEALQKILDETQGCNFPLDPAPTSENVFQVALYDSQTEEEIALEKDVEWEFSPNSNLGSVEVLGDRCALIRNAEPNRYEIRFRYASEL